MVDVVVAVDAANAGYVLWVALWDLELQVSLLLQILHATASGLVHNIEAANMLDAAYLWDGHLAHDVL